MGEWFYPAAVRVVFYLDTAEKIVDRTLRFEPNASRPASGRRHREREAAVAVRSRHIRLDPEIATDVVDTGNVKTVKRFLITQIESEIVIDITKPGIDLLVRVS